MLLIFRLYTVLIGEFVLDRFRQTEDQITIFRGIPMHILCEVVLRKSVSQFILFIVGMLDKI